MSDDGGGSLRVRQTPRKGTGEGSVADFTMLVRVPGQPAAARVYTDDERDEAALYAAEVGGVVLPLPLSPGGWLQALALTGPCYREWRQERTARLPDPGQGQSVSSLGCRPSDPSYDGTPERLAALQASQTVNLPLSALPPWARLDKTANRCRDRAVVSVDGTIVFVADTGEWLAENGL